MTDSINLGIIYLSRTIGAHLLRLVTVLVTGLSYVKVLQHLANFRWKMIFPNYLPEEE